MKLYPLAKPQESVWQMEQYYGGSIANITGSCFYNKAIQGSALKKALLKTVEQCDYLRIRMKLHNGVWRQYIKPFV